MFLLKKLHQLFHVMDLWRLSTSYAIRDSLPCILGYSANTAYCIFNTRSLNFIYFQQLYSSCIRLQCIRWHKSQYVEKGFNRRYLPPIIWFNTQWRMLRFRLTERTSHMVNCFRLMKQLPLPWVSVCRKNRS